MAIGLALVLVLQRATGFVHKATGVNIMRERMEIKMFSAIRCIDFDFYNQYFPGDKLMKCSLIDD